MTAPVVVSSVAEIAAPSPRVSGGVRYAPLGTPLPTDAVTALDAAFVNLGRVRDDGVRRTEDRANSPVYDWGGSKIAILQTQFGITVMFDLLQLINADVQRLAHGDDNVDVVPGDATKGTLTISKINANLLDTGIYVFDSFYNRMSGRLVLPYARPTKIDGPNLTHKELASFKVTLESMPNDDGDHAIEYWDDGVLIP